MIQKPFDEITIDDVNALVTNCVREDKTTEYKLTLPGSTDGDKQEFLADICSFGNAAGGDILYGVSAKDGVADAVPGLEGSTEDKVQLRLESIIRDGIDPRLQGVQIGFVGGGSAGPVFIVRIPRSWAGPHMVKFKGSSRFFSRNSAGKFQMDVTEIRAAFDGSGLVSERLARWRDDRLGRLVANEGPIKLASPACLVFHLVPLESVATPWRLSLASMANRQTELRPLRTSGWDHRINIDGFMTYTIDRESKGAARNYTQLFRSGCIEAVEGDILHAAPDGRPVTTAAWYEKEIVNTAARYLKLLQELGSQPPIVFLMAVIGTKGAWLATDHSHLARAIHPVDRDVLTLPDAIIESFDADLPRVLKPVFDAQWNASGLPQSLNYDANGNWKLK